MRGLDFASLFEIARSCLVSVLRGWRLFVSARRELRVTCPALLESVELHGMSVRVVGAADAK